MIVTVPGAGGTGGAGLVAQHPRDAAGTGHGIPQRAPLPLRRRGAALVDDRRVAERLVDERDAATGGRVDRHEHVRHPR